MVFRRERGPSVSIQQRAAAPPSDISDSIIAEWAGRDDTDSDTELETDTDTASALSFAGIVKISCLHSYEYGIRNDIYATFFGSNINDNSGDDVIFLWTSNDDEPCIGERDTGEGWGAEYSAETYWLDAGDVTAHELDTAVP